MWKSDCTFPVLPHDTRFPFPSSVTQVFESCASCKCRLFGLSSHSPSLCSILSTFTIGISTLPKLINKFVHLGQCTTLLEHWPGPWNSRAKCCIPAQILAAGLFTDPIIRRTDGLYHLGYRGQTVRTDLCSVTCTKSSVLGFRNLQSSWHVPRILLQQPPCSSHRYKYLVSLAQSFWSLNYP